MRNGQSIWSVLGAILACVVVFCLVVGLMLAKIEAYGGDESCLFVRCVKVIK